MNDQHEREIGRVEDVDGDVLVVGIDGETVTIGCPDIAMPFWQLTVPMADEAIALLITALWQAARQAGESSG